jgi:hypothetical protein
MQMRKIATASFSLLLLASSPGGKWIDNEDWRNRSWSEDSVIVRSFGETSVRVDSASGGFNVEALAVSLPLSGSSLLLLAERGLASQFGSAERLEIPQITLDAAWQTSPLDPAIAELEHNDWAAQLRSIGMSPERLLHAYRLRTKPYNRMPSRHGSSVATVIIIDGSGIGDAPCSLLVLYRTDRVSQWGWRSVHEPFSFGYKRREIDVMTNTEMNFLSRFLAGVDRRRIKALPYARSWYQSVVVWKDFRDMCRAG